MSSPEASSVDIRRWAASAAGRSHTVAYGGTVWTVSNARSPDGDLDAQVTETFERLDGFLAGAGSSRARLLSVQVILADIRDRDRFDALWRGWIGDDPSHWPQRAVFAATLAPGLRIEIIATAARGSDEAATCAASEAASSRIASEVAGNAMWIRPYREADRDAVIRLWTECGLVRPWNDPTKDIARKLQVQRELFVVGVEGDRVVASVMAGYDGHRGWVNYLAVDPARQRSGLGRALMSHVESRLLALGCPKLNLQVRTSNEAATGFYRRLGYVQDDTLSFGKRLIPDT